MKKKTAKRLNSLTQLIFDCSVQKTLLMLKCLQLRASKMQNPPYETAGEAMEEKDEDGISEGPME